MLKSLLICISLFTTISGIYGQTINPENGVAKTAETFAIVNARIVISADEVLEHGTLIVKDGVIMDVGLAVIPPKGAVKIDAKGYTLYPSFIDPYATEGVAKSDLRKTGSQPQINSLKDGPFTGIKLFIQK